MLVSISRHTPQAQLNSLISKYSLTYLLTIENQLTGKSYYETNILQLVIPVVIINIYCRIVLKVSFTKKHFLQMFGLIVTHN